MKFNVNIWIILMVCSVVSVLHSCTKSDKPTVVDMHAIINNDKECHVEDIFDKLTFLPLETNDSCLLGADINLKLVDSTGVYIESDNRLIRFSPDGRFICHIGRQGGGPGEYPYPGRVNHAGQNKVVLYYAQRLQFFNTDGMFLESVPVDKNVETLTLLDSATVFKTRRYYGDNGKLIEEAIWSDLKGVDLKRKIIYQDSTEMDMVMKGVPQKQILDGNIYFRDEWGTDIMLLTPDSIIPYVALDFGPATPARTDYQAAGAIDRLGSEVVNLESTIIGANCIFTTVFYNDAMYLAVINMDGCVPLFSKCYSETSPPDGLPGIPFRQFNSTFWPVENVA